MDTGPAWHKAPASSDFSAARTTPRDEITELAARLPRVSVASVHGGPCLRSTMYGGAPVIASPATHPWVLRARFSLKGL